MEKEKSVNSPVKPCTEPDCILRCIGLIEFLSKVLDKDYELVVLSFNTNKDAGTILAIRNGFISGRKIGDGLLPEGRAALSSNAFRYSNSVINYAARTENGNHLACSSLVLGEDGGQPVGMLSINRIIGSDQAGDVSSLYSTVMTAPEVWQMVNKKTPSSRQNKVMEQPEMTLRDKLHSAVKQITKGETNDPSRLTVEERITVLTMLKKQGVFKVRNSVNVAANFFHLSEPTIYRYLQKAL